jgi:hypothetical protein
MSKTSDTVQLMKLFITQWRGRKCGEVVRREGHGEMWVRQFMTLHISLLLVFDVEYIYFLLILIYLIVVLIVFALYSLCVVCPLLFV